MRCSYVIRDPLGVALIIAPWNYPFRTLLLPVIGEPLRDHVR